MAEICWPDTTAFPATDAFPCQAVDPFVRARISFDDFNVPEHELTWVDFSDRLLSWRTGGGRGSELEEVDAKWCEAVFGDRARELDPTNTTSPYAPNVVPNRRLWLTVETLDTVFPRFKGYVDGFRPVWPEGQEFSNAEAHVRATDGTKILSQDALTPASPDVVDYDEVVSADEPVFYYRLGEPRGTKVVIHIHKKKRRVGKGKKRRTKIIKSRHRHRVTRAETEGISGPVGTYKNTPALGQTGAIAGDPDTAVLFRVAQSEYATFPLEQDDLVATNRLTMSAWVNLNSITGSEQTVISGPTTPTGAIPVFRLGLSGIGRWFSHIWFTSLPDNSRVTATVDERIGSWVHIASTWNGTIHRLYVNGVEVATDTPAAGKTLNPGADGLRFRIGTTSESGISEFVDGLIDEVAVFEEALSATRILAHYEAAALGFTSATTGGRIGQVLTLVDAFPEWNVQTGTPGTRNMPVTRYAGVQPIELIGEAAEAEGDPAVFFFDRRGVPTFFATDYRTNAPYSTPSFVFDTDGTDIPYEPGLEISDEDAFLYNDIRVTTEGGYTARATDTVSIGRFGRSVYTVEGASLTDAAADSLATSLLARYKNPMIRLTRFRLNSLDTAARQALLSMDLGDQVRVIWRPPSGTVIDQSSHVEYVELEQAEKGGPIIGTFGISPR